MVRWTKAKWLRVLRVSALPLTAWQVACTSTNAGTTSVDATAAVDAAPEAMAGETSVADATVPAVDAQGSDAGSGQGSDAESNGVDGGSGGAGPDAEGGSPLVVDAAPPPAGSFCALPGSVVWTAAGPTIVQGPDAGTPDITWMNLPPGFCAHYYATVKTARQLKFAPGGDLFAASPSTPTTGGRGDGISGIVVLPDDNHDGYADSSITFLGMLPSVQGLMFANGYFYYQDDTTIRRVAFAAGDRAPSGASEVVTSMLNWPQASEHWPKVFDQSQDGTIYISNGGTQVEVCQADDPVFGGVFRLEADGSTSEVARGFRNPIALRCETQHDVCLAAELALDYSATAAGREKVVPVRQGDNWGFPCCATQNTPYTGVVYADSGATPDCSGVSAESDAFVIGHTPFGLDFETGQWPAPWTGRVFLTLHGIVGSWQGARVVAIALDDGGMPLPATELTDAGDPNDMLQFATGWDDGKQDHGRPAPVAFAPDGRMFLGDDQAGAVIWIAPIGLMR
jgi:glucose/arabinose dehydrogenase